MSLRSLFSSCFKEENNIGKAILNKVFSPVRFYKCSCNAYSKTHSHQPFSYLFLVIQDALFIISLLKFLFRFELYKWITKSNNSNCLIVDLSNSTLLHILDFLISVFLSQILLTHIPNEAHLILNIYWDFLTCVYLSFKITLSQAC